MLSRRSFLKGAVAFGAGSAGFAGYSIAEPWRLGVTRYRIAPQGWPLGLQLKIAVIADLHICEPWMGLDRVRQIVARTNALAPDLIMLLGDYRAGHKLSRIATPVPDVEWAGALGRLKAPLGVHAVLGNHDWWDDVIVQYTRSGPTSAGRALEEAGIPVYENNAVRLEKAGRPFWVAGLGDQWAFYRPRNNMRRTRRFEGVHDLPGTLAQITDKAPVIMMAHEPDIFAEMPDRISLTLSGHTHGGQVRVMGYSPIIPSAYGRRYAYGHIVEAGRNLVVSGGLGCSGVPIRFGVPPEIVMVELDATAGSPEV